MTGCGVLNSNSHIKEYVRGLKHDPAPKPPIAFTVETYAEEIAHRYEVILLVIRGGLTTCQWLAQEYEHQLALLAEFADEEAEVQS